MCTHHYNVISFLEKWKNVALDFVIFQIAKENISNGEIAGRERERLTGRAPPLTSSLLGSFQHCLLRGLFSSSLRPRGTSFSPVMPSSGAHWTHGSKTHRAGILGQTGSRRMHLQCSACVHIHKASAGRTARLFCGGSSHLHRLGPPQKREKAVAIPGSRGEG